MIRTDTDLIKEAVTILGQKEVNRLFALSPITLYKLYSRAYNRHQADKAHAVNCLIAVRSMRGHYGRTN
jgi:hypothetical protein